MDRNLIYVKTAAGEEATLQRTRVVQRNLRMVLLQVDGQMNVGALVEKIGNENLVLSALRELEKGGFIALSMEAPSVWEQSKQKLKTIKKAASAQASQFSTFGASRELPADDSLADSNFSSFGKPVLPTLEAQVSVRDSAEPEAMTKLSPPRASGPSLGERFTLWVAALRSRSGQDLAPVKRGSQANLVVSGAILVVLVLAAGIFLFPYNSYRADMEKTLSAVAGAPVRIGSIDPTYWPRFGLALHNVHIGEDDEMVVGTIQVPRLFGLLGSGRKELGSVEFSKANMSLAFVSRLAQLRTGVASSANFAVERIDLKALTLRVSDLSFADLNGELALAGDAAGKLNLRSADAALKLEMSPAPGGATLNAEAINWKPVENAPLQFSSLTAKGLVQPGKLVLQSLDMSVFDGSVQGSLLVDWSKGFSLAGDATLTRLSVKKLSSSLGAGLEMDGQLSGNLRWRAMAADWQGVWQGLEANLAFQVDQGLMNGVDLGEAARRGVGETVRGGVTKFERLRGNLLITPQLVTGSNLEMESGMVKGAGQFVARRDKTVDANMQISISSSAMTMRAPMHISGTLPVLQTTVVR